MAKFAALLSLAILLFPAVCAENLKDGVELERGASFPDIKIGKLIVPEGFASRVSPGEVGEAFSISEIPGSILLVEFFNCSCFTCMDQVPHLNSLLDSMNNGSFSSAVNILAIAAGNNEADLLKFIHNENPKYAITPDPEMELFFTIGEPKGTPLILILKRSDEGSWLVMDSHLGLLTARELRTRIKAIETGNKLSDEEISVRSYHQETPPGVEGNPVEHAAALFTRITGKELKAQKVDVDYPRDVFQGVNTDGKPLDLFAIVARRHSLCDICHDSVFALAFNRAGVIIGFSPVYVTRYGNEQWVEADANFMENKLTGLSLNNFPLRPDADAVSGATISSTVIFDEIRRTAELLPLLP